MCFVGADLSKTIDLTALAHVFNLPDGRVAITAHGFMPEERAAQHEYSDRVPYKFWAKDGWCTLTLGAVTDYEYLKTYLKRMESEHVWRMRDFCFNGYNASHFAQDLVKEYGEDRIIEVKQGVQTLSLPTKRLRELVLQGRVVHDGSPLFAWCLSNAVEIIDNNENIKLSKKHKSDSQRIDLVASAIDALSRAILFPAASEAGGIEVWRF